MSDRALELRAAEDIDSVTAVLSANGLPTGDLESGDGQFYVATVEGERVGVGGLERHGHVGLLRSVAVAESARGQGYGTALCAALEARARTASVEELYLLTTTAAEFFADRGYETVDREDAPQPIRETTEFASLCPESATVMRKRL